MDHLSLLQDLALLLGLAALSLLLAAQLKIPSTLGLLVSGMLLGPSLWAQGLIQNREAISGFAELGIVFIMFSIGLEFNFKKLKGVGLIAFSAAFFEFAIMSCAGYFIGLALGWTKLSSLFLGATLSISFTALVTKFLRENHLLRSPLGQTVLGILVLEDMLGMFLLAILSTLVDNSALTLSGIGTLGWRLLVFVAVTFTLALLLLPRILEKVSKNRSPEMLLIVALGICFGSAAFAHHFEYSTALGAFLVGAVMAQTNEGIQIEALVESLRDLFGAVFFVSIGMLLDVRTFLTDWPIILLLTGVVVIGKSAALTLGSFVGGLHRAEAIRLGSAMGQIGEISFIIVALGTAKGALPSNIYPIIVAVAILSSFCTPFLFRYLPQFHSFAEAKSPRSWALLLDGYTSSIFQIRSAPQGSRSGQELWTLSLKLVLLIALQSAVFSVFLWLRHALPQPQKVSPELFSSSLWLVSLVCSSPILMGIVKHSLQIARFAARTIGRVEVRRQKHLLPQEELNLRGRLSVVEFLLSAVFSCFFFVYLLFSGSGFVSAEWLFFFSLPIVIATSLLFKNRFAEVYAKGSQSLRAVLDARNSGSEHLHGASSPSPQLSAFHPAPLAPLFSQPSHYPLPSKIQDAEIVRVFIPQESSLAGRSLRDARIREETGALLFAIERNGNTLFSPASDDVLAAGDLLFLIAKPGHKADIPNWFENT